MTYLLAHEGGWDEILYFGIPIIVALLLVRWAEKRARRKRAEQSEDAATE